MSKGNPFDDEEEQSKPFIKRLNSSLGDDFWEYQNEKYVSSKALDRGARTLSVTLTVQQWEQILGDA